MPTSLSVIRFARCEKVPKNLVGFVMLQKDFQKTMYFCKRGKKIITKQVMPGFKMSQHSTVSQNLEDVLSSV